MSHIWSVFLISRNLKVYSQDYFLSSEFFRAVIKNEVVALNFVRGNKSGFKRKSLRDVLIQWQRRKTERMSRTWPMFTRYKGHQIMQGDIRWQEF